MGLKPKNSINEHELIQQCLQSNRKAQQDLYDCFAPVMKAVCRRYLYDKNELELALNQGFLKVFQNLKKFKGEGSFEGWIRRIVINTCLMENRKKPKENEPIGEEVFVAQADAESPEYILQAIASLPKGYREVFNLFEIDGYNHKEIAKMLHITSSASRSQLARAKEVLRKKLHGITGL